MQISVVGLSHKDAPVSLREHYAFAGDELGPLLYRLGLDHAGATVLSTCNRTEVYVAARARVDDPRPIVALLSEVKGELPIEGAPFFALSGDDAVRHLFRVASGIESMVVGESEVLGQVRRAFTAATAASTHTPALSRLFHAAIRVGRRVRNQTAIGQRTVSVSSTAVAQAKLVLGDLSAMTVLVIGAGEAGRLTAGSIVGSGVDRILVTSRTAERRDDLAAMLGGQAIPYEERGAAMGRADLVISSTSSHDFVIDGAMVEQAMRDRASRELLLIDIAVPRDVDPAVRGLPGVHLYDIDQLQAVATENLQLRKREIAAAERLIEEDVTRYMEWLLSLAVQPTIAAVQARAEAIRSAELERTLTKIALSSDDRDRIEAMTRAMMKKLLHDPVTRLKAPADGEQFVPAIRALFGLADAPGDGLDSE